MNGDRGSTVMVIVTDLDGTLLDSATYSAAPAAATLARLRELEVPVVFCSSKTRAEIEALMARLGVDAPFISENGGAIYLPASGFDDLGDAAHLVGNHAVIELGTPYREIVATMREVAATVPVRYIGFADMTVADIALDCGLSPLDAQLAKLREYDEPFKLLDPDAGACSRFLRALHRRGLRTVSGGRYYHATGDTDKGVAVGVVRDLFARRGPVVTVGLGDAFNDLSLLRAVDIPIIVRCDNSSATARLLRKVPTASVTDLPGPAGWARAVDEVLTRWRTGAIRPRLRLMGA